MASSLDNRNSHGVLGKVWRFEGTQLTWTKTVNHDAQVITIPNLNGEIKQIMIKVGDTTTTANVNVLIRDGNDNTIKDLSTVNKNTTAFKFSGTDFFSMMAASENIDIVIDPDATPTVTDLTVDVHVWGI